MPREITEFFGMNDGRHCDKLGRRDCAEMAGREELLDSSGTRTEGGFERREGDTS